MLLCSFYDWELGRIRKRRFYCPKAYSIFYNCTMSQQRKPTDPYMKLWLGKWTYLEKLIFVILLTSASHITNERAPNQHRLPFQVCIIITSDVLPCRRWSEPPITVPQAGMMAVGSLQDSRLHRVDLGVAAARQKARGKGGCRSRLDRWLVVEDNADEFTRPWRWNQWVYIVDMHLHRGVVHHSHRVDSSVC
jgi:hypothetical protein